MSYRADLYATGDRYDRTVRYDAAGPDEALEIARQRVVALGLDHALVFEVDGAGGVRRLGMVGAER